MARQLIGMTDRVDLPDFGLFDMRPKIDTGAYTSALHSKDVRLIRTKTGQKLRFWLIGETGEEPRSFYSSQFSQRMIRNSSGVAERRYVIQTRLLIFDRKTSTAVALAPEEEQTAIDASRALGLKVAGVDMLPADRGALVLEVNSSPGLEGIEAATSIDVAGHVIAYIEYKIIGDEGDTVGV